ncbi:hypothetical protein INS49_012056 [Diaporthe citri]|uniref:uncharacterized protein n=1 Tax=Diaporthe citri TaxID=83186 RepID=UPI001C7EBD2A|nr:uncharacterized protein INS49_012056 [Diaporthe citri]KAG6358539.1 hypothetical protein INS49_012056 [Diaporthe citri]
MAHALKCRLGYADFEARPKSTLHVFEKRDSIGGTWKANTYPGCGSDVPIHLYSYSFNLNPDWSEELCDQSEILQYIENTVDKFLLRSHFRLNLACTGARWLSQEELWEVEFIDTMTKERVTRKYAILLTAVGGFSTPREIHLPGLESFGGQIFHTAQWDHTCDYRGKRVAVIGNGCSAAQVVPSVAKHVRTRPAMRYYRLKTFLDTDSLAASYGSSPKEVKQRMETEENAKAYIYSQAPRKYHEVLVPEFALGCKRRIFDPNYLSSLHLDHVDLIAEGIREVTKTGIISESGYEEEFDIIFLATGFQGEHRLTFVHNFPNFGMLFGPNTFPEFNSVIYAVEVQFDYLAKTLFKTVIDGYADVVEVREEAEAQSVTELDKTLAQTVFNSGCNNWYINSAGRNSASWPGMASSFWRATFFPRWGDFALEGGNAAWFLGRALRIIKMASTWVWLAMLFVVVSAFDTYLGGPVLRGLGG